MGSTPRAARVFTRPWSCLLVALVSGALLGACSKHDSGDSGSGTSSAGAAHSGATLSIAGQLLQGDDPKALRAYLQSVKEVQPKKFEVTWSPDTVAIGKAETLHALQAISRDGSAYSFSATEPAVAKIRPGSILWVYNVAVRRVVTVDTSGGVTVVRTQPVALTEALTRARIEFDSDVSLRDYYMAYRPHRPAAPAAQKTSHARRPVGFYYASVNAGSPEDSTQGAPSGEAAGSADDDDQDADSDYGEVTQASNGFNGSLKGFDYSLAYDTRPRGLTLTLEARKAVEGSGGSDATSDAGMQEKFKEAEEQVKDAKKALDESRQQLEDERKSLKDLDSQYERDLAQLKADQAARKSGDFQGPKPPPASTSNGSPLTPQAEQDQLTGNYQRQRAVELAKMAEVQRIHDAARAKKEHAEAFKKTLAPAVAAARKLFEIASENLDIRFKVRADLDDFDVGGLINISDGALDSAKTQFKNLKGRVAVSYIGRLGDPGTGEVKIPLMDVPVLFNIPFPINGIPFVIQLGADFNINVFLAGRHAAMKFDGAYTFSGSGGFHADKSGTQPDSKISGSEPEVQDYMAISPGASAAVLGVQAPRVGFGLGLMGASSVAYFDVVHVMTITNAPALAMGMLTPPCKRITYTAVGHVGVETKVMPLPIPFVANAVNKQLSPKAELFHVDKEVLDPPITACEVK